MILLGILGGWVVLSCAAAPFIGHFIALNAAPIEHGLEAALQLAPGA